VTRQRWEVWHEGRKLAEADLGELPHVAEDGEAPPRIVVAVGTVVLTTFEPSEPRVEIKTDDGGRLSAKASPEMVDRAVELRGGLVRGTIKVDGDRRQFLRIDPADANLGGTPESRLSSTLTEFDGLLRRLAK